MKCVKCGKEQAERSIHCPYCGHRLQRDEKETVESASLEERPTLIEFPTPSRASTTATRTTNADWRTELSERVRQVKERRNLQEARGRLQAELVAAAQRYQQSTSQTLQPQLVASLPSPPVTTSPAPEPPDNSRSERESERHINPIIDAALRRAQRASEIAGREQYLNTNLAMATAAKPAPQVQPQTQPQAKPQPAIVTAPLPQQPSAAVPVVPAIKLPEDSALNTTETVEKITKTSESSIAVETTITVATPTISRPRLLELDQIQTTQERPIRVIKESETGPNYLDELISICKQNLANEHARYSQRIVAAIIDIFVIALANAPYWVISFFLHVNLLDQRVLLLLGSATLTMTLVYLTLTIAASARTFGMMFVGIHVINSNTGAPPTFLQACLRSFGYLFATGLAGLGFAWLFIDREHRGLHDLVSGTSVVRDY
ncbi:MAG: RDD family protein [Acidobacteriota bacterium]